MGNVLRTSMRSKSRRKSKAKRAGTNSDKHRIKAITFDQNQSEEPARHLQQGLLNRQFLDPIECLVPAEIRRIHTGVNEGSTDGRDDCPKGGLSPNVVSPCADNQGNGCEVIR